MCAQGLILVNATSGQTTILANRVSPSSPKYPGAEMIFADDLDVASDGTVYFSTMTDIALPRGPSGHYEAMPPCVLNIMQVRLFGATLLVCMKHAVSIPASEPCNVKVQTAKCMTACCIYSVSFQYCMQLCDLLNCNCPLGSQEHACSDFPPMLGVTCQVMCCKLAYTLKGCRFTL